jgi:hypothetical protein
MYVMTYWYRDSRYGKEHGGEYYTNSLTDVFAFGDMIKRLGGTCMCDISGK